MTTIKQDNGQTVRVISRRADFVSQATGQPIVGWYAFAAVTRNGIRVGQFAAHFAIGQKATEQTAIEFALATSKPTP